MCLMLLFSLFGMLDALQGSATGGQIALCVVAFILGIAGGIGLGLLFYKLEKLGAAILAGALGFFLGSTLYNLALFWAYNVYLYFIFSILCALLCAFLAWKFFEHILIVGTAILGGYSLIRGISMFAGHYPSEVEMISQLANGIRPQVDGYFYIYMAGLAVAVVAGIIVQNKFQTKKNIDDYYKIN